MSIVFFSKAFLQSRKEFREDLSGKTIMSEHLPDGLKRAQQSTQKPR